MMRSDPATCLQHLAAEALEGQHMTASCSRAAAISSSGG